MARDVGTSNRPFPVHTLEKALQIIQAIVEAGASRPMDRLLLAQAIGRTPSSSEFRRLLSSSLKYGLTEGTEKADLIKPTQLGLQIARPVNDSEKMEALVRAARTPELFNRVYGHFNKQKVPRIDFLRNVLARQFSVEDEHTEELANLVIENAKFVGILQAISGSDYLNLDLVAAGASVAQVDKVDDERNEPLASESSRAEITTPGKTGPRGNRVFITHGRNKKILEQVKEIVAYGKFEPVVAQEHETAAKPVPEKVMDDMRSCQAAVINVSSEGILKDKDGKEHAQLNGNVLIEIGAAMALYGKQFILLVEEGVKLPSNLQGLYECRYEGNELSGEATMKLLKSFNEFR
jgi:predicted nucleotide-binding protein